MYEITKEEIMSILLLDGYIKNSITADNLNIKKVDILTNFYNKVPNHIELDRVKKIYYGVLKTIYSMDMYSLLVDYLLNRNSNIDENDISRFKSLINIKNDVLNSTNSSVVKKIRYAYNHNDDLNQNKFKIYVNHLGSKPEISMDDFVYEVDLPNPQFSAEFNFRDVWNMIDYLSSESKNKHYLYVEGIFDFDLDGDLDNQIDNIHIIYYPLKNSFPIKEIEENLSKENLDRSNKEEVVSASDKNRGLLKNQLKQEVEDAGGIFNENDYVYYLDSYQKEKLKEIILLLKSYELAYPLEENIPFYLTYAVHSVLPIPYTHLIWFSDMNNSLDQSFYLDISHNDVIENSLFRLEVEKSRMFEDAMNNINVDTRDFYSELRYFLFEANLQELIKYSLINWIKYYLTNLTQEEYITVDDISYEVRKLRNSLVHYRWFSGVDSYVIFYDAVPNHEKVYDFNYCQKIDVYLLAEECRQMFLQDINVI